MIGPVFAVAAGGAGIAQAAMLARSVGRSSLLGSFFVRYALVAVVLFAAARAGQLLWAAPGWAVGFALAASIMYRRIG